MAHTTTYTLVVDGTATDFVRSTKQTVINEANRQIKEKLGYKFEVVTTASGKSVYRVARRHVTKFTKPYTKTVDLTPELAALVPAGYVAAYARPRNGAVVLRVVDKDLVEEDSRYAVLDVIVGSLAGYAPTTRIAGKIMKALPASR